MWTMLWLFMTTTGGLTSGAADFPTREACEAARQEFGAMLASVSEGKPSTGGPDIASPPEIRCVAKATGKR